MYSITDKWILYGVKLSFEIKDIQILSNRGNYIPPFILSPYDSASHFLQVCLHIQTTETVSETSRCLTKILKKMSVISLESINQSQTNESILTNKHILKQQKNQNRHSTLKPFLLCDNATNYRNVELTPCIMHVYSALSYFSTLISFQSFCVTRLSYREGCHNNFIGCIYSKN